MGTHIDPTQLEAMMGEQADPLEASEPSPAAMSQAIQAAMQDNIAMAEQAATSHVQDFVAQFAEHQQQLMMQALQQARESLMQQGPDTLDGPPGPNDMPDQPGPQVDPDVLQQMMGGQ